MTTRNRASGVHWMTREPTAGWTDPRFAHETEPETIAPGPAAPRRGRATRVEATWPRPIRPASLDDVEHDGGGVVRDTLGLVALLVLFLVVPWVLL